MCTCGVGDAGTIPCTGSVSLGQTLNDTTFASLAQSVEHETFKYNDRCQQGNLRVAGSSPAGGFFFFLCSLVYYTYIVLCNIVYKEHIKLKDKCR